MAIASFAIGCASAPRPSKDARLDHVTISADSSTPPEQYPVSGQVRLADGAPAAGALVALVPHFELEYPGPSPEVAMVVCDAQGRFSFRAAGPGRFGITATLGTRAVAAYGGAHDINADTKLTVDLQLATGGFAVRGEVKNAEGAPVARARIEAVRVSENESEVYMTTTDAGGHYQLQLATGALYFLVADARGLPRTSRRLEPTTQEIDFKLDRAPAPRPPDDVIETYLAEHALPLATIQPGKGTADLVPFQKMIGDSRLVAIGEPVHGSAEFWLLRHRFIELLTAELGFTTIAIEAGWSDTLPLDDYVMGGPGDPLKGLSDLHYWPPNTEETLALLRWMRRYNRAHARKLHFRGFDVEYTSHAVAQLVAYLDKVDPPLAARARELLAPLREETADVTYAGIARAEQEKTQQFIRQILAKFDDERQRWTSRSTRESWATAREHAEMIRRSEMVYRDPTRRDAAMAETVESIIDREPKGSKILLLGHNFHVSAVPVDLSEMGQLLRQRHGSDYFVIGTTFGSGSLHAFAEQRPGDPPRASHVDTFTVGPPPSTGLEASLALAQRSLFALDLRQSSGPVGDWLDGKMPTRSVGGVFHGEANADKQCAPKKSYDVIVYIDRITPSHLNPGAN